MAKGELVIKNDELSTIIGRLLNEKTGKPIFDEKTPQEQGEDLVGTYALDMLYSGMDVGVDLDFAYSSLKDLPIAAKSCYERYKKGDHSEFAVGSTAKSLAAYFFVLAMNEHGFLLNVRQMPVLLNATKPPKDPLWGVFRIQLQGKKKTDFLLPVSAGCGTKEIMGKKLITFDLALLFREYRATVGEDLEKRGLHSIAFDL